MSGKSRAREGLLPEDAAESVAGSPPAPALHPAGDCSTAGSTAAGHLQSLEVRGVALVKKLKLFG